MRMSINTRIFAALLVGSMVLPSCGGDEEEAGIEITPEQIGVTKTDLNNALKAQVNGITFNVPSPIQTAELIREANAEYNEDLMNSTEKAATYATEFHKALNLGVYGADLAYITINNRTERAMSYVATATKLAEELNISGAFNDAIIQRFQDNMDNQDSVLVLVGEAFRSGNAYLQEEAKNNEEKFGTLGLILAGGWIETMYYSTKIAQETNNQSVINRIGEQKATLDGMIKLLQQYRNDDLYDELVEHLSDIQKEYYNIKTSYNHVEPQTFKDQHLTKITSSTTYDITPETLTNITDLVEKTRSLIVK